MLHIKDKRHWFTETTTSGIVQVNETYFCFSLEDTARPEGVKIPKKTCIPPGKYRVIVNQSKRFNRLMPLLLDVPLFSGIRVHWGNEEVDTEGCPLVGYSRLPDKVYESKRAFEDLFKVIVEALARNEEVIWEVINEPL